MQRLPYELLVNIATYCKPRTLCALIKTCKAAAALAVDESLFKQLCKKYKINTAFETQLSWKGVFITVWCVRKRIANKPVKCEIYDFIRYDAFLKIDDDDEQDENLRGVCNCISHFGYSVLHLHLTQPASHDGSIIFVPFHLPPPLRKIHLYNLNFENHMRRIKQGIDNNMKQTKEISNQPPFNDIILIADGLVVWSHEQRKYCLVYDMAEMFRHYQRKHTPSMVERIAAQRRAE